ncbi:MAG: efflux RND transporter periplasmic adaptor subunit [bacterium]
MNERKWLPFALIVGVFLGYLLAPSSAPKPDQNIAPDKTEKTGYWTCSMHPQVKLPGPGKCPICAMDLIPASTGTEAALPQLTISESGRRLARITTSPVERKFVTTTVNMVGKIDYDETRLIHITAWVGGRLDRLFVDYTGVPVKKGDHMVEIYSPDLISAQEEFLVAMSNLRKKASPGLAKINKRMAEAARQKLILWGLTPGQLQELEKRGKPSDHVIIYAPQGGIVIQKQAVEGAYVNTGTRIYTIADLTHVWVKLDAYESDLSWIRFGQKVEFTTQAYPGKLFKGRIAFIDPVLNSKTRTVKVRVNVLNPRGELKPGMFVRASVKVNIAAGGLVRDNDLAGKWISPMHPEIVKDHPGKCDICGMPLVRTESLGFVSGGFSDRAPLVIPASAPLITGRRAVVYVEDPQAGQPTYSGREIVLGQRAGDYYLVTAGLKQGERVVTNGNFKIDSALQIQALPSMMSPDEKEAGTAAGLKAAIHHHKKVPRQFKGQLNLITENYFSLKEALVATDKARSLKASRKLKKQLAGISDKSLNEHLRSDWKKSRADLNRSVELIIKGKSIEEQRQGFAVLSETLAVALKSFGHSLSRPVRIIHCPMAFAGRGGDWLQLAPEVRNPYFGSIMLKCGDQTGLIPGSSQ